jgi:hypothetical protein
MEPDENQITWQRQIHLPAYKDDDQYANAVKDSLGLMGWTLPWEVKKDSSGFQLAVSHFGKDYTIRVPANESAVAVQERRKGFWAVFNSLHFLGGDIPNAPLLINTWKYYQNITVAVLLFSVASGVYIFMRRKKERAAGLIVLFACITFSLLLILSVWL